MATTDESGNLLCEENYQPYGKKIHNADCVGEVGYTGHVTDDELGLTYMQARYYDPVIGRFMAVDPVGFDVNNVHSFNRYAYANNSPYSYIDPDGEEVAGVCMAADFDMFGYGFGLSVTFAIDDEGDTTVSLDAVPSGTFGKKGMPNAGFSVGVVGSLDPDAKVSDLSKGRSVTVDAKMSIGGPTLGVSSTVTTREDGSKVSFGGFSVGARARPGASVTVSSPNNLGAASFSDIGRAIADFSASNAGPSVGYGYRVAP